MKNVEAESSKQSIGGIPDYNHLFDQSDKVKDKKKKGLLSKLLKMNTKSIIANGFVYLIQASPTWAIPIVSANLINLATVALGTAIGMTQSMWIELAINVAVLAVLLFQNVPSTRLRWRIVSRMNRRMSAGIKSAVVRKLQSLSITYHKDVFTGKIQSKFIKDTETVDMLFSAINHNIIPHVLTAVVSLGISIYRSPIVALFFVVVVPVNLILTEYFRKKLRKSYRNYRISTETMSAKITNMLEMMFVTKSHGLEQTEIKSADKTITELATSGLEVDKNTANFGAWLWVVNTFLSSACLVFCVILAIYGKLPVGDIVLYQSMFSQITTAVSAIINATPQIASGSEALCSISEIMNATEVEINVGKKHIPSIQGNVKIKDLYYSYPNTNETVLSGVSLEVKAGECVAVVGSSGSGKTTLMNMLIGFMMPTKGDIEIDGKSITELNLSEYRSHISVVPQNSILFPGTVKENITYGLAKYTEEQLETVIEMANLNEVIEDLPQGIETQIGEHGNKLSGGQKQRITIARALIRNPRILILDEATSALDNLSEYHVQKAISASIRGRTTFIVAHRLSTIRDADRIVVLEEGKIVEVGSYDELMQKKGRFFELKELSDANLKTAEMSIDGE